MKILLVEDSEPQRRAIASYLECSGHSVTATCDGEEALLLIEQGPDNWEILVTDYKMPKMNGIELITEVLKRKQSLRAAVVFSGTTVTLPKFNSDADLSQHIQFVHKDTHGLSHLVSVLSTFDR